MTSIDYRRLNAVTWKKAYLLPKIADRLGGLSGSIFSSTLDLVSGHRQVPLDQEAKDGQLS